ncbi:MAG: hypothetical protein HYZ44_17105 [Bacteroidetes bacterium]|nr:hypothetical protein [Bacteroidota bacterium]
MKYAKNILLALFFLGLVCCSPNRNYGTSKSLTKFVLSTINDPRSYELPLIEVTDTNLFHVLDSAIISLERCEYFDERIKYWHAFSFSDRQDSVGNVTYSIHGLHSVDFVLGLYVNRQDGIDKPMNFGVFYFKNYLFVVSLFDEKNKPISYPFCRKTECTTRIKSSALLKNWVYGSRFRFIIDKGNYQVIEDHLCASPILPRH